MKIQSQKPKGFDEHIFQMSWSFSPEIAQEIWNNLQRREFFIKGQFPLYKVEFDSPNDSGPFEFGELNIHHGPLLSLHGSIGEINSNYRDLIYFYGSYILSFRLIRPTRLEFFKQENTISVKITTFIRPMIKPFWNLGLKVFWKIFANAITLKNL